MIVSLVIWLLIRKKNKVFAFICIFVFILSIIFFLLINIPYLINELYMMGNGYETDWGAKDVLSFYGDVLAFIGTTVLGIVAFFQNKKLHEETERREKMNNSRTLPSLLYDSFLFDVGTELGLQIELVNQISSDFSDKTAKYTVYVQPNKKTMKKNPQEYIQIKVNGGVKYRGEARCNRITINSVYVYYGNSHEVKKLQQVYEIPDNTKNITRYIENDNTIQLSFRIISNKDYNDTCIINNDKESIFLALKLSLYDIAGIAYNSTLELQYSWNGTRYIFVEQIYTIDNIDYLKK